MIEPERIQVSGLNRSFRERGGRTILVLQNVDFEAGGGEIVGILGPNGAGKTTLLRILGGVLQPDAGSVRICGGDPFEPSGAIRDRIGFLPEEPGLPNRLRVAELLGAWAGMTGTPCPKRPTVVARISRELGIDGLSGRALGVLSQGQRRRVALARALLGKPSVLLLDEPTASLDIDSGHTLWECLTDLAGRGSLLVLATHSGTEVERICTRVAFLDRGSLEDLGAPCRFRDSFRPPWKHRLRFRGPGERLHERLRRIPGAVCLGSVSGEQHWWAEASAGAAFEAAIASTPLAADCPRLDLDRPLLTFEDAYLLHRRLRGESRTDRRRDGDGG